MPIYGRLLYNKNHEPYGFWQPNPLSYVNLPPIISLLGENMEPYSAIKSRFADMYPVTEQSLPIQVGTVFRFAMQKDGLKRLTLMLQLILGTST